MSEERILRGARTRHVRVLVLVRLETLPSQTGEYFASGRQEFLVVPSKIGSPNDLKARARLCLHVLSSSRCRRQIEPVQNSLHVIIYLIRIKII